MNPDQMYAHKPNQISSIADLIAFFSGIPENKWCEGALENGMGNHCAMGHIGQAYEDGNYNAWHKKQKILTYGTRQSQMYLMVCANNGDTYDHLPTPKARVLAYLHSLEPHSPPTPSIMAQVTTLSAVTS